MKEKAFCHENGRRFFRAMRDAGAVGRVKRISIKILISTNTDRKLQRDVVW